jgi:hypothetical protein
MATLVAAPIEKHPANRQQHEARPSTESRQTPVPFNSLTGAQQRLVLALLRAQDAAEQAGTEKAGE